MRKPRAISTVMIDARALWATMCDARRCIDWSTIACLGLDHDVFYKRVILQNSTEYEHEYELLRAVITAFLLNTNVNTNYWDRAVICVNKLIFVWDWAFITVNTVDVDGSMIADE